MNLLKPKKLRLDEIRGLPDSMEMEIIPKEHNIYFEYMNISKKFITDHLKKKTSDKKVIRTIEGIAGEMINNGIWHGNEDSSKPIRINVGWKGNKFYFVVRDEGKGFNMAKPKVDWEFDYWTGGLGMGIFLSKKMVDRIYNFKDPASYVCMRVPKNKLLEAQNESN